MASSTVPSTALTIQIAKASMVYAGRDIAKKAFRANPTNQNLALQLAFAYKTLEWTVDNDSSNIYIKLMRNYTLMLCGQYIVEATSNIGSGGIVITPTNSVPIGFAGYRNDFTIGEAGSPMIDGDSVLVINQSGFINKIVMMYPSGINLTIGGDAQTFNITSIVYTTDNVTITLDQAVHDGERYIVTGLIWGAAVTPSSGGGGFPIEDGHEGQVLFTDGAGNRYWGDVIIDVDSSNFEPDGITVNDTRMVHNQLDIYYNEGGRWLINTGDNAEFVRLIGGGFTIQNILGFNANVNSYTLKVILRGLNS